MQLHRTFSRLEPFDTYPSHMDDYDNDEQVQTYLCQLEPIAEEKPTEDDIALLVEHVATPETVRELASILMDLCTELEK